jgi:hypothetical protein
VIQNDTPVLIGGQAQSASEDTAYSLIVQLTGRMSATILSQVL